MIDSEKNKKYDRQIRIWGEVGQELLEKSRVCVITASATGTESLKNLVLPGVGAFTLIDGAPSSLRDLGVNFFVTQDAAVNHVNRAEIAASLLQELNSSVEGGFIPEPIEDILNRSSPLESHSAPDSKFFSRFSLVIVTQLPFGYVLRDIADRCWYSNVPLIIARAYGMMGYIRVIEPEHFVQSTAGDAAPPSHYDLRITKPFGDLIAYCNTFDLDESQVKYEKVVHAHIPYIVILVNALQKWRRSKPNGVIDNLVPKDRAEQNEIRDIINSWRHSHDEENFSEALKNVRLCWDVSTSKPSYENQQILDDPKCASGNGFLSPDSEISNRTLWLYAAALREFVTKEGEGCIPLNGSIPDLIADTESYVTLQQIYRSKAERDLEVLKRYAQQLANEYSMLNAIEETSIKRFTRNAKSLQIIRYKSLSDELDNPLPTDFVRELEDPQSCVHFYIAMRAADRFYKERGRYPGYPLPKQQEKMALESSAELVTTDFLHLKKCVSELSGELGITATSVNENILNEFVRFGGGELHNVASILGGVVGQEAVKLLTRQFIPVNNMLIFNCMTCSSGSYRI